MNNRRKNWIRLCTFNNKCTHIIVLRFLLNSCRFYQLAETGLGNSVSKDTLNVYDLNIYQIKLNQRV